MGKRKNGHGRIDFGMKSASGIGVVSSCLAGAEFFLFLGAVYLSYLKQGQAGFFIGIAGFAVFVLAVTGTVLGAYGMTRGDRYHGADLFGMLANGVILIGICALFVWGTLS